ncbi:MAG: penicillin-binding transpeptidase domain-containing protein, partial [Proteobacteria bacterium]|nr:penicillin-binding transpeptidase domain-containing protein [Pseudomonadota bacterium]
LLKDDRAYITDPSGTPHQTTIDPDLQLRLQSFIAERGSPIASAVVSDIATGRILALVQGRSPDRWGSATHTSLHNKFPAASLFKTVVTAAAMEITPTGNDQNFGLPGGCGGQDILPKGDWMNDDRGGGMTLRRAFGHSCNSFFAKLAINQLGLGTITHFAKVFGWEQQLPTDFVLEPSKMLPPGAANSTTHTVGRFAAGFGHVGISPVHANWIAATIGNRGLPRPLILFTDSDVNLITPIEQSPLVSAETTSRLLDVMKSTVNDGTASTAFGRGRYRSVAQETGGKTGTLNGRSPRGLTTLFYGVYPLSKPQIAVSAIVVLEDHFAFKASQLAAEAIVDWRDLQDQRNGIIRSAILEEKYMPRIHKRSKARHSRRR